MTQATQAMLKTLTDAVAAEFAAAGFVLKRGRHFERVGASGRTHRYTVGLSKQKGWYSLHLTLGLLDRTLMAGVDTVLEQALRDEAFDYPESWPPALVESSIKTRVSNPVVAELTDWRSLRDDTEALDAFNARFWIWLRAFDSLDEVPGWQAQLSASVTLSLEWFRTADAAEWIEANTDYPALYLLHRRSAYDALQVRYQALLERAPDPQEMRLFHKHLSAAAG